MSTGLVELDHCLERDVYFDQIIIIVYDRMWNLGLLLVWDIEPSRKPRPTAETLVSVIRTYLTR
jgi:hypothetical protein